MNPASPNNITVSVQNLEKKFGAFIAVNRINFQVQQGEIFGFLGPNGAGKSTTIRMLCGIIPPTSGSGQVGGYDIIKEQYKIKQHIGYMSQKFSLYDDLTVEENILSVLEVVEPDQDKRELVLENLLGEFSIAHLRTTSALALSGGERRRVEIARALACNPQYIMLDEPLAGIDPIAVNDIRELIYHLKDRNIGVLITDHNVRETLEIVDRALILNDGVILTEGLPREIITHKEVKKVYLGESFSY